MSATNEAWCEFSMESVCNVVDPHPSHRAPPISSEGIPFPGIGDFLTNGAIDPSSCRHVDESVYEEHKTRYKINDGDIGFGRVASIGKVVRLNRAYLPFAVSPTLAILQPKTIDPAYLFQYLQSAEFLEQIRELLTGTTRSSLGIELLRKLRISAPSKTEQSKIAEVLSTVDRAIEQTEALIAKQQRIKTGLMQDLLTRGIDEHGNLRSEQTHKFKDSPLAQIPEEWDVCELGTIARFVTSGSRGWAQYYCAEGAIFLRIGNLTREHINLQLDDIAFVAPPMTSEGKRTSVSADDLLISITADLGIIGVIPQAFPEGYVNQHIALVRLIPTKVNARFVGWFLSGHAGQAQFERVNESGAKAGLNLPTIKRLLVALSELAEQTRVTKVLDTNAKRVRDLQSTLEKCRALKTGLMQDLLTGKKLVTALQNERNGTEHADRDRGVRDTDS